MVVIFVITVKFYGTYCLLLMYDKVVFLDMLCFARCFIHFALMFVYVCLCG